MPTSRALIVWDLPTRLFHWTLVVLVALLWVSGTYAEGFAETLGRLGLAGIDALSWHRRCGYGVAGLLVFRLLWGLTGSETARFRHFLRPPGVALRYLRELAGPHAPARPGHNPAGAWMVLALLAALSFQVGSGLLGSDDYGYEGPLAHWIDADLSQELLHWHRLSVNLLLGLVGLHLLAILGYYLFKRDNLVRPMLTGRRHYPAEVAPPRLASLWLAGVCALLALGAVWALAG